MTVINKLGREAYLKALQKNWPEVLKELQYGLFPKLQIIWEPLRVDSNPEAIQFWDRLNRFTAASQTAEIKRELRLWAKEFNIRDPWMMDLAFHTMYMFGEHWRGEIQGDWTGWIFFPFSSLGLFTATFSERFWIP